MDIKYISKLSNIKLKEEEEIDLSNQLKKILNYIKNLEEVDIKDIPPTFHAINIKNVFREDKEILEKNKMGDFFIVPKILEN